VGVLSHANATAFRVPRDGIALAPASLPHSHAPTNSGH